MPFLSQHLRPGIGPTTPPELFIADLGPAHVDHPANFAEVVEALNFEEPKQRVALERLAELLVSWSSQSVLPEGRIWVPDTVEVGARPSEFVIVEKGLLFISAQHKPIQLSKKQAGPKKPLRERSIGMILNTQESPKTTVRQGLDDTSQRIILISGKSRALKA